MNGLLKVLCVALLVVGVSLIASSAQAQWGCGHGGFHSGFHGGHGGFYGGQSAFYGPSYGYHHGVYARAYPGPGYGHFGVGRTPYVTGFRGYPYGNPYRPFGRIGW